MSYGPEFFDNEENLKEAIETWEEHLQKFKEDIYPTFASFGLTLPEALLIYEMRTVTYSIQNMREDEE